jgi:hypothetical protein
MRFGIGRRGRRIGLVTVRYTRHGPEKPLASGTVDSVYDATTLALKCVVFSCLLTIGVSVTAIGRTIGVELFVRPLPWVHIHLPSL